MPSAHGKFVWYELLTLNTAAAEAFYRSVIGWGVQDAGVPGMSYTLFKAGETSAGGMMALTEDACAAGAKPGWMGYVAVDDADASAAQAVKEGGKVHYGPDDIPGVGRFAVICDPQGATLALFKPAAEAGSQTVPRGTPGHGGWHELLAADSEEAFAFYAKLFGWKKAESIDMGAMGAYQIFSAGGENIGGMRRKPDTVPAPFWLYYFNVDEIGAAAARVKAHGGEDISGGPHQVPGGSWILHCRDPQGAMFALVGPRT
jgi:predicted enzyme related to lactoylglutathione lyase